MTKTKSSRIDKKAELVDFISRNYIYDIIQLVADNLRERGAVVVKTPSMDIGYLKRKLLKAIGNVESDDVKQCLEVMKKYNMSKEVVLMIVDEEGTHLEALAVIEVGFKPINLKGK